MAKEQESQSELRELPTKLGPQRRAMSVEGYDADARTVTMAISSEQPVERYFGTEILSHKPGAIRMNRLKGGMPLLFNHDSNQHLGVTTGHELGKDGVLRTVNKLGSNPLAREKEGDLKDGILKDVSLAYIIHKATVEEDEKTGHRTITATDWEPLENSLVTIPADPTVGVGRSAREAPDAIPVEYVFATRSASAETTAERMEGDEDEEDEDEEDEDASDSDSSRSTQPTETRTTMAAEVTIDHAALETERIKGLRNLRTTYPKHFSEDALLNAISGRSAIDAVQKTIADTILAESQRSNVATIGDKVVNEMSEREKKQYSLVRSVRFAINQRFPGTFKEDAEAGFEREVSGTLSKRASKEGLPVGNGLLMANNLPIDMGSASRGARAMGNVQLARDLTAGGNAGAATIFTTTETTAIELLRARARCLSLGATSLSGISGLLRIPRQNSASSTNWLAELAPGAESDIGFDSITFSPKRLNVNGAWTIELLNQSAVDVEQMARADQTIQKALTLDAVGLIGTGTNNMPLGLFNQTGVSAILTGATRSAAGVVTPGPGGVALTYIDCNNFESVISSANADIGDLGWLVTPRTRGALRSTPMFPGTYGMPIWPTMANRDQSGIEDGPLGYRAAVTTQLPQNLSFTPAGSTAISGLSAAILAYWPSMVYADWGISELVYDNITQAAAGVYQVIENSLHDVNFRHLQSFATSQCVLAS